MCLTKKKRNFVARNIACQKIFYKISQTVSIFCWRKTTKYATATPHSDVSSPFRIKFLRFIFLQVCFITTRFYNVLYFSIHIWNGEQYFSIHPSLDLYDPRFLQIRFIRAFSLLCKKLDLYEIYVVSIYTNWQFFWNQVFV